MATVKNLVRGKHNSVGWLSDGGKVLYGKAIGVERSLRGINITIVDESSGNQRNVSWRMSEEKASEVINSLQGVL
jgi:hypothetical protein